MPKTVYRQICSVRRTSRPRISASHSCGATTGAFDSLLAKLGFASQQLKSARKRAR